MTRKTYLKLTLLTGLVVLALGGWLLHLRFHPPLADADNLVPFVTGIVSIVIIPLLFWFRSTAAYAYVINGFMVIIGTITMAHFGIVKMNSPLALLPDIAILWGNFFVGKALFDLEFLNNAVDPQPRPTFWRYFRYPNNGWWLVHLVAWSAVYALGHILWR
jgi:hypothetical protein